MNTALQFSFEDAETMAADYSAILEDLLDLEEKAFEREFDQSIAEAAAELDRMTEIQAIDELAEFVKQDNDIENFKTIVRFEKASAPTKVVFLPTVIQRA